jgi:ABC-2 type transport system permease protein
VRPELIIAEKEFRDHLSSKRFLVIFTILLLLIVYGVYTGMSAYDQELGQYKDLQTGSNQTSVQGQIISLQAQIQHAEAQGDNNTVRTLKEELNSLTSPVMPSVLEVFTSIIVIFTFLGMILGASMGFDQISREREEGSIKFLAASPLYRDSIINGKTLGAIITLAIALAAAFLVMIAVVMFMGVIPGLDDMLRILIFYIVALLYSSVFLSIAMTMSVVTKSTSMSVICTIGIIAALILFSVLGAVLSSSIAGQLGTTEYQVSDSFSTVSPVNDFGGTLGLGTGGIGQAILNKTSASSDTSISEPTHEISIFDSLASVWIQILVLVIEIVVAFSISYVAFMRMDIR